MSVCGGGMKGKVESNPTVDLRVSFGFGTEALKHTVAALLPAWVTLPL